MSRPPTCDTTNRKFWDRIVSKALGCGADEHLDRAAARCLVEPGGDATARMRREVSVIILRRDGDFWGRMREAANLVRRHERNEQERRDELSSAGRVTEEEER